MLRWINYIRDLVEVRIFGVCNYLGEKMGIPSRRIRLFFVYATFVATWSPLILYMIAAFVLNLHRYVKSKKNELWDL